MSQAAPASPRSTIYITPAQLVERYEGRISIRTLANWRWNGTGPLFTRVGGRILYRADELAKWEGKNTVNHTGSYKK